MLWDAVRTETGRGKSQFKIRDLLAYGMWSQPVLGFLGSTDVGRRAQDGEDAESEVSEWELREQREKEERKREAEELGAGGEEALPLPPTPHLTAAADEGYGS